MILPLIILWFIYRQVTDVIDAYRFAFQLPELGPMIIAIFFTLLVLGAICAVVDAIVRCATGDDD